jgi:hypothetical protein
MNDAAIARERREHVTSLANPPPKFSLRKTKFLTLCRVRDEVPKLRSKDMILCCLQGYRIP